MRRIPSIAVAALSLEGGLTGGLAFSTASSLPIASITPRSRTSVPVVGCTDGGNAVGLIDSRSHRAAFGRTRIARSGFIGLIAILLACGAPLSAAPMVALEGDLLELDALPFALIGDAVLGSARLESASADDLRATPGPVSLETFEGGLTSDPEPRRTNGARRVDPASGRPLEGDAPPAATCPTGAEPDCWDPGDPTAGNADLFDALCDATLGSSSLDLSLCALTIFNSNALAIPFNPFSPTIAGAFGALLSGQSGLDPTVGPVPDPFNGTTVIVGLGGFTPATFAALATFPDINFAFTPVSNVPTPLVPLVRDVNDGSPNVPTSTDPFINFAEGLWVGAGVSPFLTDQQEALLGCGPFYQTGCDLDGVGLFQAEVGALLQSFPVGDGGLIADWDTTDGSVPQPGTIGSGGDPACDRDVAGDITILPGCRGPADPGFDVGVDGSTGGAVHPFTGQAFRSETAVLSWNLLMLLAVLDPGFDPDDVLRTDGCSLASPQLCANLIGFVGYASRGLADDPSGPPAPRWLWETGAEYEVAEATGAEEDFVGWTLHVVGPEHSRVADAEVGAGFVLAHPPEGPFAVPDSTLVICSTGPDPDLCPASDAILGAAYLVAVDDTEPPEIEAVSADPGNLWPPNHRLAPVSVSVSVSDDRDDDPTCRIVSVESSEPDNGRGDGNTTGDFEITGDLSANLRAERSGRNRSGRVYTIHVECSDAAGNTAAASVEVTVAHDQGKRG